MKTAERPPWCLSDNFIANFEHVRPFSSVSIVDFEQVNAYVRRKLHKNNVVTS